MLFKIHWDSDTVDFLLLRNAFNATLLWCACFISFIKNAFRACCNPVSWSFCPMDLCQWATHLKNTVFYIYGTIHVMLQWKGQTFLSPVFDHMAFYSTQSGLHWIGNGISSLHHIKYVEIGFMGRKCYFSFSWAAAPDCWRFTEAQH